MWQCLVDNSQLFFAPLLDQFNALYQQVKERTPIENLQVRERRGEGGREGGREKDEERKRRKRIQKENSFICTFHAYTQHITTFSSYFYLSSQREGDIAKPFQTLLAHFSPLPPKTAQFLFVHFVGIIMRHSEQALSRSSTIKHCVLELLRMVSYCTDCVALVH